MTQESVYWLFTASAQTVAAFVAFLLAGFTLVVSMMDTAAEKDDSLVEIHLALKREYYGRLRSLSWLTALAIVTDLLIVPVQGTGIPYYHGLLHTIGTSLNVLAIILAVLFILLVVDPDRYQKTARALLVGAPPASARVTPSPERVPPSIGSAAEFIAAFIPIERKVRELASRYNLATGVAGAEPFVPFVRLLRWLVRREAIPFALSSSLEALARHRNLVVHGNVEGVEPRMITTAMAISAELDRLLAEPES